MSNHRQILLNSKKVYIWIQSEIKFLVREYFYRINPQVINPKPSIVG